MTFLLPSDILDDVQIMEFIAQAHEDDIIQMAQIVADGVLVKVNSDMQPDFLYFLKVHNITYESFMD